MTDAIQTINESKVLTTLKGVVSDAQEILNSTKDATSEKIVALRESISLKLRDVKERLQDAEASIRERSTACARATDDFVNDNPWKAVGIGALVGLVVGVLIGRR